MRLIDADKLLRTLDEKGIPFNADINDEIDNAPTVEQSRWIPCGERLPKDESTVLVYVKLENDEQIDIATLYRDVVGVVCTGVEYWLKGRSPAYAMDEVVAWMPLPDAFEVDE